MIVVGISSKSTAVQRDRFSERKDCNNLLCKIHFFLFSHRDNHKTKSFNIIFKRKTLNQRKIQSSCNLFNSLHPLITTKNGRRRRTTDRLPSLLSFSLERPSLLGNPMDVTVTILPLPFLLSHRYPYRYVSLALLYIFCRSCLLYYYSVL